MKKLSKPSLKDWRQQLLALVLRFPTSIFFCIITCASWIFLNHKFQEATDIDAMKIFLMLYPVTALLLSLQLHLWTEEWQQQKRAWQVHLGIQVVWLGICAVLANTYTNTIEQNIAIVVLATVMGVGWFTLPYYQQRNDRPAINFLLNLIGGCSLAFVISLGVLIGLSLLLNSLTSLFLLDIKYTLYLDLSAVCFTLIAPLLLMASLPQGANKFSESNWLQNRFGNGVIHYLLIPLHMAYTITLYAYTAKIIITWELPNGWVSWLVSVLMLLTVTIVFLLYPIHHEKEVKRFDQFIVRYLPVIVLPLLVLMSVGIYRRFSDYGVTIYRLYLLIFNVWCYAVCLGLMVCRSRRVIWIINSFLIVWALISIFPYNIASYTRNKLTSDVKLLAAQQPDIKLPMNSVTYGKLLQGLSYIDAKKTDGKLSYLRTTYGMKCTEELLQPKVETFGYEFDKKVKNNKGKPASVQSMVSYECNFEKSDVLVSIPAGYHHVASIAAYDEDNVQGYLQGDSMRIVLKDNIDGQMIIDEYLVSLSDLEAMANTEKTHDIKLKGKKTQLTITYFLLRYKEEVERLHIVGYVFVP